MAVQDYATLAQTLYVTYFGRPGDYFGMQSFQKQLNDMKAPTDLATLSALTQADKAGTTALSKLVNSFSVSKEATDLYGTDTSALGVSKFVEAIYLNVLGRAPDAQGWAFWTEAITSGNLPRATAAAAIADGAVHNTSTQGLLDAKIVANKIAVATDFTNSLVTVAQINGYAGNDAAATARDMLTNVKAETVVTDFHATVVATVDAVVAGSIPSTTVSLTTGVDTIVGGSGNDIINANEVATATGQAASLTALDNLDGGNGIDTLNVSATAVAFDNITSTNAGLTIKNIEVANFQGTKALTVDSTGWTGLTNLNVTKSVAAATLTVSNTTDVKVAGADAAVTVTGGKSVTVTQSMDTAADAIVINKAGNVTVTATDSKAAAGDIAIGTGAGNAVTGTVVVNSTGAKLAGGTGAVVLDAITVVGGTTVSITQKATADQGNIATAGILTDVITQGAVVVTGTTATTSVTVVQDDQVKAKTAVAGVTGVSATNVVTFKSMALNDTITVDGLTFHASKALTAAEAAAAFAGLTADENQGQGYSLNGYYTGVSTGSWNTSAVSGTTVTYSQDVAGTGTLATPTGTGAATPTVAAGVTAVPETLAVVGRAGVANGAVTINDNATAASIKTIVVDGYSAGATLGNTNTLNALTDLTLANSGTTGTAIVKTSTATLNLNVNDVAAAVTLTDTSLKTLNITTATKDSAFVLNTVTTVEALNVTGTNAVDLTATALTGLKTVTVGGSAGLTVDASNATSFTTTTTGTVNAKIDSTKATYVGGAGVDNVTFSNITGAAKAVSLGDGNDSVTLANGTATTTVPTLAIDGGNGIDTLAMASADAAAATASFAAKFTGFEKLSLGAVASGATDLVDLSKLNNISYVISAGAALAAAPTVPGATVTPGTTGTVEFTTFSFGSGLTAGQSFTIDGVTVTASATVSATVSATDVAGFFRALTTPVVGLTYTGSYATPAAWAAVTIGGSGASLTLSNSVNGDVADFTAVTSVGAAGTGALAITKMANAGTLELTGSGNGAIVTMTDATSTTADVLNVVTKLSTAGLNYGTLDVAGVETVNLSVNDTAATTLLGGVQTASLTLKDAALKTINVTGNAHLTLVNDVANVAVTLLDATTFTGNLNASTNGTVAQTIKGGTGDDVLFATNNSNNLADTLVGGAGDDILVANRGLTTMTGGAGMDTFIVGAPSLNVNSYSIITDASAGDIIKFAGTVADFGASKVVLGATAVFQDFANAATVGNATNNVSWFQFGGDTYIVKDVHTNTSGFENGSDMIVKLIGIVDLSHASYSATLGTIEIGL